MRVATHIPTPLLKEHVREISYVAFVGFDLWGYFDSMLWSPRLLRFDSNLIRPSGFVMISAIMSEVEQYVNLMFLCSICSRIKWCAISMCFVRLWFVGLFARVIVDWLSCWMSIVSCLNLISSSRCWIHSASFVAIDNDWYSACVVDVVTNACLCVCQDTIFWLIENTYPVVEHLSSRSSPQSASHEPVSSILLLIPLQNHDWPRMSTMSVVPWIYQNIHFTAIQCVKS